MRSEDWLTLLLASAVMLVVVRSVEAAEWVPTPSLSLMVVPGALVGLLAARIPWKAWQVHLAASAVGAVAVYLQGSGVIEAEALAGRMAEFNSRLAAWWTALMGNGISTDPLPFALILSMLAWTGGYLSSWAIFRLGNLWLAILPGAFGMLINLTNLPERYIVYIFPYLLATLLLMMRLASIQRQSLLERQGITLPFSLRTLWLVSAIVFSSLIVGVVFLLPKTTTSYEGLRQIWNISRRPAEWTQQEFGRVFSSIDSKKPTASRQFGTVFPIMLTAPASDEPVFFAQIPYATYWQVRAYGHYTSGGWTTDDTILEQESTLLMSVEREQEAIPTVGEITYRVETAASTPYLYVPSQQLYSISIPALIETHEKSPPSRDMVTVRPEKGLETGKEYVGVSSAHIYSEDILRAAGRDYPQWVKDRYLQLPPSFPERVNGQANAVTREATNPYDKARAIEEFLRTFDYDVGGGAGSYGPDFGDDRVDHFLFESQAGHSDHFASAMTVMLRAVGIPARMISGYGPGVPDPERMAFTVGGTDRHSWPQAFFPGLDWVDFEPSPIYDLRPRAPKDLVAFNMAMANIITDELSEEELIPEQLEPLENDEIEEVAGGPEQSGFGPRPFPLVYRPSPLGVGGALLVGLVVLWAIALWLGGVRFYLALPSPGLAYLRMCRMAGLLGVTPKQGQTPLEFGHVLAATLPAAKDDVTLICETFSKTRYGHSKPSAGEGFRIRLAWARVRKAMVRHSLT